MHQETARPESVAYLSKLRLSTQNTIKHRQPKLGDSLRTFPTNSTELYNGQCIEPNDLHILSTNLKSTHLAPVLSPVSLCLWVSLPYSSFVSMIQDGVTPLWVASHHGHKEVCTVLIAAKAFVDTALKVIARFCSQFMSLTFAEVN